jgi:hypothetical protein
MGRELSRGERRERKRKPHVHDRKRGKRSQPQMNSDERRWFGWAGLWSSLPADSSARRKCSG